MSMCCEYGWVQVWVQVWGEGITCPPGLVLRQVGGTLWVQLWWCSRGEAPPWLWLLWLELGVSLQLTGFYIPGNVILFFPSVWE
jgi:hypothetical protein